MYQALYRKYRPKTLDDICGQNVIVTIIKNSIINNQINHAYLFAGPRGTGKTSTAKIFAKIVNCEHLVGYNPCNKCNSCTQKSNSDIIEIDAASNNGVDEIRELRNNVNLLPANGKYKIYIIDEVHMLTTGAFNALLKTLEEPPEHVIFILATTDPHKIPETILSRCQRLDFKKITKEAIVENLQKIATKENIKIELSALEEIARLSDGGMRDSVGMLDQARAYTEGNITIDDIHDINGTITEKDLTEFVEYIVNSKLDEILKTVDDYNEKGKNFVKLTEELINFFRNTLLFKEAPEYLKSVTKNVENYEKISKKLTSSMLFSYIDVFTKSELAMKNEANTKLLFELALIKIISEKESQMNVYVNENLTKEEKNIDNSKLKEKTLVKNVENSSKDVENSKKDEQKVVKNDSKTSEPISSKPKISVELQKQIENIKKIRIENTLSKFEVKTHKKIIQTLDALNDLLLNPEYSHAASILLDGQAKATTEENMIFVYKNPRVVSIFNENLPLIEDTIEKALNKKYNLIATTTDDWEIIKKEFNTHAKEYKYQEENFDIKAILSTNKDNIATMFEDIIEYN